MSLRSAIAGFTHSFMGRMMLGLLAIHAVLLPPTFFLILKYVADEHRQEFVNNVRAHSLEILLVVELEPSEARIAALLEDLVLGGQVIEADFIQPSGRVVPAPMHARFVEDFHFGGNGDSIYFIALPVHGPSDASIGTLRLGFDESHVSALLQAFYLRCALFAAGYALALLVVVGFFGNALARSIRALAGAARSVARGDATEDLNVTTNITEIAALARDLEQMRRDILAKKHAEEASAAKSRFLAHMSHEIRTPMNGVIGMVDLLLRTRLDARQRHFAETIKGSGANLLAIINDILDLSKIESGMVRLQRAPLDLRVLAGDTVSSLLAQAHAKGLKIEQRVASDVPQLVLGDSTRLRQVLTNLIGNAIKFTDHGSISVDMMQAAAEPGAPPHNGTTRILHFQVRDTGTGIDDAARDRLFHAFSQADDSITRRFGGTGLGLAICRQLVEMMGGTISYESEPGRGSRFWFTLPFDQIDEPAMEPHTVPGCADASSPVALVDHTTAMPDTIGGKELSEAAAAPIVATRLRVLLVEDNLVNLEIARLMLEQIGCEVLCCDNGRQAVQLLLRESVNLVLMDCNMPEMDGLTATRWIRSWEATRGRFEFKSYADPRRIPIVALTANAYDEDRDACLASGMDDFLPKPVTAEQLEAAVRRWALKDPPAAQESNAAWSTAAPSTDPRAVAVDPSAPSSR